MNHLSRIRCGKSTFHDGHCTKSACRYSRMKNVSNLRIAGVLGSIDEKIELNRKKIAELEALAKTIYDY